MNDEIKNAILSAIEASLEAQLRAIRHLREHEGPSSGPSRRKGPSQVNMAFEVLAEARSPLHVSEILLRIHDQFGVSIDRESLVSSLTKKMIRGDRFLRPERNTFALREQT